MLITRRVQGPTGPCPGIRFADPPLSEQIDDEILEFDRGSGAGSTDSKAEGKLQVTRKGRAGPCHRAARSLYVTMDNYALENALAFAELGHAVFPLHGITKHRDGRLACTCGNYKCDRPGKHPFPRLAPHGLKDATVDEGIIRGWWRAHDWLNAGICTDDLLVIDIDPRHDGNETWRALERKHGEAPHTWRALTGGGGDHIFFALPEQQKSATVAASSGPGSMCAAAAAMSSAPAVFTSLADIIAGASTTILPRRDWRRRRHGSSLTCRAKAQGSALESRIGATSSKAWRTGGAQSRVRA